MSEPVALATADVTFAHLLRDVQGPLFGFVRGLAGDDEQARDIVQDVFVDAWRAARGGTPPFATGDTDGMRRWLFHAAYVRAAGAHRRGRIIRWESLDANPLDEASHPREARALEDQVIEAEVLREALASLEPEDAACVLLKVVQGFTAHEIAHIVGVTPEAAKKRVTRAKQRLRAAYFAKNPRAEEGGRA